MTDLRTPLARARGLGSGKTGTSHFWYQRVTAVALMLLVPWLVWMLASMAGGDVESVRATLARPWNAILLAAFCVAMFWHAKLGVQVVIEDYVHTRGVEITLHLLNMFLCTLGAIASVYAIARIALTA
ncbi:succinate dehydrogenase, hydrophobic membrane anchor protein [Lysobacter sp. KIS68-7]|uniref:succinate dehydrogenase, hydrophobic membrane anchor protein n=1 Tax=Lysobacter sp. KIS68-7 TaxID=2904252 RepID=UPI001E36C2A1|nr:succinate dehydrogenase, hydrophobic membrane anchor protein [Lysobacter sp. KIS68-7]UHQ19207.1 succinate dehydrogenase, hydrophobic membrane anchor protein [Lysobacter sp. KIS68-7]